MHPLGGRQIWLGLVALAWLAGPGTADAPGALVPARLTVPQNPPEVSTTPVSFDGMIAGSPPPFDQVLGASRAFLSWKAEPLAPGESVRFLTSNQALSLVSGQPRDAVTAVRVRQATGKRVIRVGLSRTDSLATVGLGRVVVTKHIPGINGNPDEDVPVTTRALPPVLISPEVVFDVSTKIRPVIRTRTRRYLPIGRWLTVATPRDYVAFAADAPLRNGDTVRTTIGNFQNRVSGGLLRPYVTSVDVRTKRPLSRQQRAAGLYLQISWAWKAQLSGHAKPGRATSYYGPFQKRSQTKLNAQ